MSFKKPTARVVVVMFLICLSLMAPGGGVLALEGHGTLQIHHETVTGSVSQRSLRLILDQFQEQLGVEYTAPKEDLEQRVSVALHGESLRQALAKILAQWDYALTIDSTGKVQTIFIVKKKSLGEQEEKVIRAETAQHVPRPSNKSTQTDVTFMGESQGAVVDEGDVASPSIGIPPSLRPEELVQQNERERQEIMDKAGMGMIPHGDYPEMEVGNVSFKEQKNILQTFNSSRMESVKKADFQTMNISPVSEEKAQEILRSFNLSIGSSKDASQP